MLTDHWVIAQLLALFCLTILFIVVTTTSVQLLKGWKENTWDEYQTTLERKSFLVSSVSQVGFWLQLFLIIFFLVTVNTHLPPVIKGAMCAFGVLDAHELGRPVLWLKLVGFVFFMVFGIVNKLDLQEKTLPLSPKKYWLVFPIILLLVVDLSMSFLYFKGLSPDVISTCCSVDFLVGKSDRGNTFAGVDRDWSIWVLYLFVGILIILQLIKRNWAVYASLLIGGGVIYLQWLILKNVQVAYIYGVPDHHCIYDIFLSRYFYIGFVFLLGTILLLYAIVEAVVKVFVTTKGLIDPVRYSKQESTWLVYLGLVLLVLVPLLYQVFSGFHF